MSSPLPPLFFFTDPVRTPNPERIVERLPPGCGVVFRAYGASDAVPCGRRLSQIAHDHGLLLLTGADPKLARLIGASGVHLPERLAHRAWSIASARPEWVLTTAAHSRAAVRRGGRLPVAAVFVSPVFASASASAGTPLEARVLRRWTARVQRPVFALGGVDPLTIGRLLGSGAAGVAAVDALLRR